jgi:hypothetical protein
MADLKNSVCRIDLPEPLNRGSPAVINIVAIAQKKYTNDILSSLTTSVGAGESRRSQIAVFFHVPVRCVIFQKVEKHLQSCN